MRAQRFHDRHDAGRRLAALLAIYEHRHDVLVFAVPRGGVPVAFEVAAALRAPLGLIGVRKLGVPGCEELAMGAIGSGGVAVLDGRLIAMLGLSEKDVQDVVERERRELVRQQSVFCDRGPSPRVGGKIAILVDDGLATGASMFAAVSVIRGMRPARIVVAVPVAPAQAIRTLRRSTDDVVCFQTPKDFGGVGSWYDDFRQVSDEEVRRLLAR